MAQPASWRSTSAGGRHGPPWLRGDHYRRAARRRARRWAVLAGVAGVVAVVAAAAAASLVVVSHHGVWPGPPLPGVIRAGDSKTNCIYVGGATVDPGLSRVEAATGVAWSCIETFSDQDPTWTGWTHPWIASRASGVPQWLSAGHGERSLVVSEDLIPLSLADTRHPLGWETACDEGAYDGYARTLARALVRAGEASAVVRLGKEMNGEWEPDFVGPSRAEQGAWARCFAREVTAMRSVPGSHLLFDWNPNACTRDYPLSAYYPGNAYVDIVGIDLYDTDCASPLPTSPSPASWRTLRSEPLGLAAITRFASAHGKPMSIPEWGLPLQAPAGGDDPYYVDGMASYVATSKVAFQAYFNSGSNGILPLERTSERVLEAYQRGFGSSGRVEPAARARAK